MHCTLSAAQSHVRLWEEWERLLARVRPELRLFSPAWYAAWCETLGSRGRWSGRMQVLTVRDEQGELQGLLPVGWQKAGPFRAHAFGGDWQPGRPILAATHCEAEVGRALGRYVSRSGWNVLQIGPGLRSSPAFDAFLDTLQSRGVYVCPHRRAPLALANLPETWDLYREQVLGGKFFRKIGYYERRMTRAGEPRIIHYRRPTPDETARLISDLATIEGRSWLATSPRGHLRFATADGRQMWTRLINEQLSPQDQLDCWVLSLGERPVSFCLTLTAAPVRYVVANSFDEEFKNDRTGSTLYRYMIEEAFSRGVRQLDFGDGELHYKQLWGAAYEDWLDCYLAFPNPIVGGLARAGFTVKGLVQRLRHGSRRTVHPEADDSVGSEAGTVTANSVEAAPGEVD